MRVIRAALTAMALYGLGSCAAVKENIGYIDNVRQCERLVSPDGLSDIILAFKDGRLAAKRERDTVGEAPNVIYKLYSGREEVLRLYPEKDNWVSEQLKNRIDIGEAMDHFRLMRRCEYLLEENME